MLNHSSLFDDGVLNEEAIAYSVSSLMTLNYKGRHLYKGLFGRAFSSASPSASIEALSNT
jgi:hypothetical protein